MPWMDTCSSAITKWAGSSLAFLIAFLLVLGWAVLGPYFRYSETWQITINTVTTIITFLMVFLVQHSQNKDAKAIHLKLDELVKAVDGARDAIAGIESQSEEVIDELKQ